MTTRSAYRISLAAGLVVIILSLGGSWLPAPKPCGELADNYPPIIAFELARSVQDLQAIFGHEAGVCRDTIKSNLDRVNWIDWLLYIPAYGLFLIFFFVGMTVRAPKWVRPAINITLVACVADYIENRCLFALGAAPDHDSIWLILLFAFTEIKWVGLGIATLLGGVMAARGARWKKVAVIPCAGGLLAALISIANPGLIGPYLSFAFALGWVVLFVVAGRESFRKHDQP